VPIFTRQWSSRQYEVMYLCVECLLNPANIRLNEFATERHNVEATGPMGISRIILNKALRRPN